MDPFIVAKIRQLSKQRRRRKRALTESKQHYSESELLKRRAEAERKKQADDLIQTIIAMELVGGDTKALKIKLHEVLFHSK